VMPKIMAVVQQHKKQLQPGQPQLNVCDPAVMVISFCDCYDSYNHIDVWSVQIFVSVRSHGIKRRLVHIENSMPQHY